MIFDKTMNKKDRRKMICGSNLKIKLSTNKENYIDLEEGIKQTIDHIKNAM